MTPDNKTQKPFDRLELLVGKKRLDAIRGARVVVFGVGGVGSWCAEGLVRSGVGAVTIVDHDVVCVTNINRQLQATSATVGESKVDALARRLREINPNAKIEAARIKYGRDTKDDFHLDEYDYVIDAIDSLSSKVELIINAHAAGATIFSSLGAANKIDPLMMKVSSIWETDKCKLGRFVRKRLRRRKFDGDLLAVWSGEEKFCGDDVCDVDDDIVDDNIVDDDVFDDTTDNAIAKNIVATNDNYIINTNKNIVTDNNDNAADSYKTINGSFVCVTAAFGFTLAGLVVRDIIGNADNDKSANL